MATYDCQISHCSWRTSWWKDALGICSFWKILILIQFGWWRENLSLLGPIILSTKLLCSSMPINGLSGVSKKCTPWLFWGSINGEGGSPLNYIRLGPRFLLALSHEHTLNTITMATAAAMVWSGTVVGTTINRRQTPQWTYMTLWCEGIFLEGLWTLFLGFLLRKWPLLIKMRQLHRPPHSTHNLLTLHTCP